MANAFDMMVGGANRQARKLLKSVGGNFDLTDCSLFGAIVRACPAYAASDRDS